MHNRKTENGVKAGVVPVVLLCTCSKWCTCTPAVPAAAGCCAAARAAAAASAAASARRLASKVSRIAWTCLRRWRATVKRQHSTGTPPQLPFAAAAQAQAGDYWLSRVWHLQMRGCNPQQQPLAVDGSCADIQQPTPPPVHWHRGHSASLAAPRARACPWALDGSSSAAAAAAPTRRSMSACAPRAPPTVRSEPRMRRRRLL